MRRFMETINSTIEAGRAKRHKAFTRWAAETASKPAPKNPLVPKKKSHKEKENEQALVAQIRCFRVIYFCAIW